MKNQTTEPHRIALSGLLRALFLASLLLSFPLPSVRAQDMQIQQLRIQVMPEFDDPRVLVIVQGRLNIDGQTPQTVTFRLPANAQINQMAAMDVTSGAVVPETYDSVPDPADSRWVLVSYTLDSAHFFYEYYDDSLDLSQPSRQFTYIFNSPLAVADLQVDVQEPSRASNFTLSPSASLNYEDESFGFSHHQINVGALAANTDMKIDIAYSKADATPSISRQQLVGGQAVPTVMPSSSAMPQLSGDPHASPQAPAPSRPWAVVLGGLAAVVLLAGLVLLWRSRQPVRPPLSNVAAGNDLFCRQCGAALQSGSRFCHVCGQPVPEPPTES